MLRAISECNFKIGQAFRSNLHVGSAIRGRAVKYGARSLTTKKAHSGPYSTQREMRSAYFKPTPPHTTDDNRHKKNAHPGPVWTLGNSEIRFFNWTGPWERGFCVRVILKRRGRWNWNERYC